MIRNILKKELIELSLEQLKNELDFYTQELNRIKHHCKDDYDFKSKSNYISEKIKIIKSLIQEKSR